MKASIIICTYNRADTLSLALECLQWQSYDNFEVIVVNGPSIDHTEEVLDKWGKKITVLNNPEKNPCISRNMATNIATGDILCFIDDDSEPDTPWLANIMHEFNDPAVGGVTGPTFDSFGVKIKHRGFLCDSMCYGYNLDARHPRYCLPDADPFIMTHGCNMSFRRCVLEKVGGFLEELVIYHEEPEICRRIIDAGYKIVNTAYVSMVHQVVTTTTADTNIRCRSKGMIDPFHPIKNKLYLIALWGKKKHRNHDYAQIARNRVSVSLLDAKYRYDSESLTTDEYQRYLQGATKDQDETTRVLKWFSSLEKNANVIVKPFSAKLTTDEYHRYQEGATKALKWFLNIGNKANFIPPKIKPKPPHRLVKFQDDTQKPERKLTICLLLWSLDDLSNNMVKDFTLLAKVLANRGHEIHLVGSTRDHERSFLAGNIHYHYINYSDQKSILNINDDANTSLALACKYYNKVLELRTTRLIDVVMGSIYGTTSLFCHLDKSLNTVLSRGPIPEISGKNHSDLSNTNHNKSLMALQSFTVNQARHIRTLKNFSTPGATYGYFEDLNPEDQMFFVPGDLKGVAPYPASGDDDEKIRIMFTGPLEDKNGVDVLPAAVTKLMLDFDHIELIVADYDQAIFPTSHRSCSDFMVQYQGTTMEERVYFLGNISAEDRQHQYALCDISCWPSLDKSGSLPVIEAMSFGKPVVGWGAGGIFDAIVQGEAGLLAQSGDISSLVDCLKLLVTNRPLRKKLGKAARTCYENLFSFEKYGQAMEKHFYRIATVNGENKEVTS